MRCKKGDVAIILRSSAVPEVVGMLVDVIERAPKTIFRMPNGSLSDGGPSHWVIKFQRQVKAKLVLGGKQDTTYGVIADSKLWPIRDPGDDAQDETLTWKDVPQKVEA